MKVQIISSLLSNKVLDKITADSGMSPAYAPQKFYRVLAEGFVKNNVEVEVISNPPIFTSSKTFVRIRSDNECGIKYKYMYFIKIPVMRHICLFINSFFACIKGCKGHSNDSFMICDILCYSTVMGALIAAKIAGKKIIGLVTDLPWLIDKDGKQSFKFKLLRLFQKWYIKKFTHYIFLTEQMGNEINTKGLPAIIIEGFANIDMQLIDNKLSEKQIPKQIIYAGFLQAKYGLKMLLEAFISLNDLSAKLIIYGTGPFADDLIQYQQTDNRIEYRGLASNKTVVDAEIKATLLVNPRPTHEEYTKYSFPSKNMEYMVSGTPLLTTKLPGMPKEYLPYVYAFTEESVSGFAKDLKRVLDLSSKELHDKGLSAKNWVLENKNNRYQCQRILDMINQN